MHHHHHNCHSKYNSYHSPRPEPKRHKFIDTILVEKFTVNRAGESRVDHCCEPIPAGISVKNSCVILSGITDCITPDTYYTFDVDRALPFDFNALQVFIKAEPCQFMNSKVGLEYTEVTVPYCAEPSFTFTPENLKRFYQAKYPVCKCEGECKCTCIPHKTELFLEVELDLRGNMTTTNDFFRGREGAWCNRPTHRYVLYANNSGRLVLTRDWREVQKFGDFR